MEKNAAQISGFAVAKKAPSHWNKFFFEKKILPAYLCRCDLQNSMRIFFLNKWVSIKLLMKLDRQKVKKIPRSVLETIISQIVSYNFSKIGLNPEELELLEYALVITFLWKVVSEGFLTSFNFWRDSCRLIVLISWLI